MGLKDWLASGWLIEHEPSAEEIAGWSSWLSVCGMTS
jgi:hypothetical protein